MPRSDVESPEAGLTRRAFAARAEVSHGTVNRWVAAGKLPTLADGKIPAKRGLAIARGLRRKDAIPTDGQSLREELLAEQLRERRAKADAREADNAIRRGELVERRTVEADARRATATIRDALLALPARVALQVEGLHREAKSPEIEALIADEINEVLAALHATRFGREP